MYILDILCVSHNLRLPKKIFVRKFRAIHRWEAERETFPSVQSTCAAELIQPSFRQITFCSAAILLYEGYQNVGEKQGPLSGRRKAPVFFQTSAEQKICFTYELMISARR